MERCSRLAVKRNPSYSPKMRIKSLCRTNRIPTVIKFLRRVSNSTLQYTFHPYFVFFFFSKFLSTCFLPKIIPVFSETLLSYYYVCFLPISPIYVSSSSSILPLTVQHSCTLNSQNLSHTLHLPLKFHPSSYSTTLLYSKFPEPFPYTPPSSQVPSFLLQYNTLVL